MWEELGISGGTAIIILISFYFVIKWAVRNAISECSDVIAKAVKKGLDETEEKNRIEGCKEGE